MRRGSEGSQTWNIMIVKCSTGEIQSLISGYAHILLFEIKSCNILKASFLIIMFLSTIAKMCSSVVKLKT